MKEREERIFHGIWCSSGNGQSSHSWKQAGRVCTRCYVCVRPPGQLQKFTLNHEMDLDWKWQTLSTPSVAQTLVSDTRLALKSNELPFPSLIVLINENASILPVSDRERFTHSATLNNNWKGFNHINWISILC